MLFPYVNEPQNYESPDLCRYPTPDGHLNWMSGEVCAAIQNQHRVDIYIESPGMIFSQNIEGTIIKSFTHCGNVINIATKESYFKMENPSLDSDDMQSTYYKFYLSNDCITMRVIIHRA